VSLRSKGGCQGVTARQGSTPQRYTATFVVAAGTEVGPIPVADGPPSLEASFAVADLVAEDGVQRVYGHSVQRTTPWHSEPRSASSRRDR